MRHLLLLLLSAVLAFPSNARPRAIAHRPTFTVPGIDAIAASAINDGIPGVTIGVRKSNAWFTRSWGNTQSHSVYQVASVTKQFTAAAIMRLSEEGKLAVSDRVRLWLPELDSRFDAITIEHLLTHTSGLRDYIAQLASAYEPKTQQEIVALIANGAPRFAAGSKYEYSNSGYFLLGIIIERAGAKSYTEALRDSFFTPLALLNTSYCGTSGPVPNGYFLDAGGTLHPLPAVDMSLPFSAGALCSNADDLLRWTHWLSSGVAVSPQSYARMTTPFRSGYGYGLVVDSLDGRRFIWHNGAIRGFQSHAGHFPDEQLTIVVLLNALEPNRDRATELAVAVARAMKP